MTPAPQRQPDHTHRAADHLLPPLMAVWGVALGLVWVSIWNPIPVLVFIGGELVGVFLTWLYWNRYRVLGFAPYALTGVAAVALVGGDPGGWPLWLVAAFPLLLGVARGAIARHRAWFNDEPRRHSLVSGAATLIGWGIVVGFLVAGPTDPGVRGVCRWVLVGLAVWTAAQAWLTLLRPTVELTAEPLIWVMFRQRAVGPGLTEFPRSGPVLVIANHAAWLDPLYLAKVIQRPTTPMMTARFFNLPVLRPILRHVIRVIVVPEAPVRREAPEVNEAIAALDAGRVVVIFPEGYLRRKEEQVIRRFGQGVWQMLHARPKTPVLACWIEGGWGSYLSYFNGPPTKNKRFDIRRPIGIGLSAPEVVPADVLADHLPARVYLMNRVLEARKHLGLPPEPPVELPARDEPAEEPGASS
ncbi:MAG TPA: 1-acyl-sn-glycerol-3-phosphate acyltransferase [Fimbriiglobus sp.]|nr:1-acyl-sn-glycerol-3-phosphate acyltransferase [Fimbriiglobus sp.]